MEETRGRFIVNYGSCFHGLTRVLPFRLRRLVALGGATLDEPAVLWGATEAELAQLGAVDEMEVEGIEEEVQAAAEVPMLAAGVPQQRTRHHSSVQEEWGISRRLRAS
jgi:hypothetical protein